MERMRKPTKEEQAEARELLLTHLRPGDKVYTIIRHVSRSGMSRRISTVIIKDNKPMDISPGVARVLEYPYYWDNQGIRVDGCGMDMGFAIVYNLGRALFPQGFKVEGVGRNGDTSGWDKDGGYALKQGWL